MPNSNEPIANTRRFLVNPDPATPTSLEEGLSTLHHEIPWPAHPFFAPPRRPDTEPWLIISGPSRMGNHLLLSLLDGHPQLPDSPGEDGFLSFGFQAALKDPDGFLDGLRRSGGAFLRQFAANEKFDKWRTYADHARAGRIGASPSGVGTSEIPAVFDYRVPERRSISEPSRIIRKVERAPTRFDGRRSKTVCAGARDADADESA